MARKSRITLTGMPYHVVQRGNNRQACFFAEQDFLFYVECLKEAIRKYQCQLHAYVLMTNHVHLLMTPQQDNGISKVMQSVGRRYVQYINYTYRRTGTLWEGRYKSSLVDADHYLLACYRYIELNPVRANMVNNPAEYRWLSYRWHADGEGNPLITDHDVYLCLGGDSESRQARYRELFRPHMDQELVHAIRVSIKHNAALGSELFKAQIETAIGRCVRPTPVGRPRKFEINESYVSYYGN